MAALDSASPRGVVGSLKVEPQDELIGALVTRSGILPVEELSGPDQETLSRLKLNPAFVGVERRMLRLAVLGDISSIETPKVPAIEEEPSGPREDGTGVWILRLDEDDVQVE